MLVCLCVYTGTSGLVPLADAEEEEEEEGDTRPGGARSSCRRQWRLAQDTTCQQAGVCLAGILCPVDLDLSHPPLSRGNFAAKRTCVGFLGGWIGVKHNTAAAVTKTGSGRQQAHSERDFELNGWMDEQAAPCSLPSECLSWLSSGSHPLAVQTAHLSLLGLFKVIRRRRRMSRERTSLRFWRTCPLMLRTFWRTASSAVLCWWLCCACLRTARARRSRQGFLAGGLRNGSLALVRTHE
jgi:hypothetical protein